MMLVLLGSFVNVSWRSAAACKHRECDLTIEYSEAPLMCAA
jgi:hypothetical protein